MSEKPFADQTVVVTGGGSGIGRATALAFAGLGAATVIVTGRRKEPLARVAALDPAIVPVIADVTTETGAEAVAEAVRERTGLLDVLVHNAGVFRFSPLTTLAISTARELLETNVVGPLLLTHHVLPLLRSPGGSIVLVSSRAGHAPGPEVSAYAATKAAVNSFTRSWAAELAPRGIRVNAVAPGYVRTDAFAGNGHSPERIEEFLTRIVDSIPLGRVGVPEEIAPWITRLAEPASSLITGQVITIDGGLDISQKTPDVR